MIVIHRQSVDSHNGTSLDLRLQTTLRISADEARRRVNRLIIPELGTGLSASEPELSLEDTNIWWRVPIMLSLPRLGTLGIVGTIKVDAQSGEIAFTLEEQENLINHARWLYSGATLPAD